MHSTVLNSFAHVRTHCAARDKSQGNEVILGTASADSRTLFMENVLLYLRKHVHVPPSFTYKLARFRCAPLNIALTPHYTFRNIVRDRNILAPESIRRSRLVQDNCYERLSLRLLFIFPCLIFFFFISVQRCSHNLLNVI